MDRLRTGKPRCAALLGAVLIAMVLLAGCRNESVDGYLRAGDAALQAGRMADAERNYSEAAGLRPADPRVHLALGKLYVLDRRLDAARIELMKVIEAEPKNVTAHAALGGLYAAQRKPGLAEEQFRAASVLEPSRSVYHLKLGEILKSQGKPAQAEAEIRTAIGLKPRDARGPLALALLLESAPARRAEALEAYARARALDPALRIGSGESGEVVKPKRPPPARAEARPRAERKTLATRARRTGRPIKVRPVKKLFRLTRNSPVHQLPDTKSKVLARVHQNKYVRVTGFAGDWLRIRLKSGTVGFIPTRAVE